MKDLMRKIFSPILQYFETGEGEYQYKPSHRTILIIIGCLFLFLASVATVVSIITAQFAGIAPILIFFSVGIVCEVVGLLGSDRAVSRIWKSR